MTLASIIILRHGKTTDTHGSARWALRREIKKMGFGNRDGVVLGKVPGLGIITHNGPEHIFLSAPTRSGKGVSFIIPTLFSWRESVVVLDLKKENWAVSAGFRSKFSHVICFDPTSNDGACWNPLLEVRRGARELQDTQNIADILIDPNGSKKNLNHWDNTAHSLLVVSILHVLYAEQDKSLSGVANFLANPNRGVVDTLVYMKKTHHIDGAPHPIVASIAQEMLNKSPDELSGVVSTAATCLKLYRDPVIARNTAKSDFTINDLMNAKYPVSLYLVVPAGDIGRLTSLNRLIINMICRKLTGVAIGADGSPHKHKMLLLIDEFPALGHVKVIKESIGFFAGYGIKCMLVCQSYNNIYEHYGEKNPILDNCHIKLAMAPNDHDTAKIISTSLGQSTVKRHQINFTGKRLAPFLSNISIADQETGRNLLNPDEVQKFPKEKVILQVASCNPAILNRVFYYKDKPFNQRCINAPVLSQTEYIDKPTVAVSDWEVVDNQQQVLSRHQELYAEMGSQEVECISHKAVEEFFDTEGDIDMQICSNRIARHTALGVEQ